MEREYNIYNLFNLKRMLVTNQHEDYDSISFIISKIYLKKFELRIRKPKYADEANEVISKFTKEENEFADKVVGEYNDLDLGKVIVDVFNNFSDKLFGIRGIEISTNKLSSLAINLLKLNKDDTLIDYGSGLGTFLINSLVMTGELKKITGVEISISGSLMSNMALACLLDDDKYEIIHDKIEDLNKELSTYTKSFIYPPFGLRHFMENTKSELFDYTFKNSNSYEWILIDKMLSHLDKEQGRAVAVVTGRCLFTTTDFEYRKSLFEAGLIEGIVEIPKGALLNTNISTYLVVFSNNNDNVRLLALSENKYIKPSELMDLEIANKYFSNPDFITSSVSLSTSVNVCPSNIINENVYKDSFKDIDMISLNEVAEVYVGSPHTKKHFESIITKEKTNYQILTSGDISDGIVDWDNLPYIINDDDKLERFAIHKNDMVITSKSSKFKTVVLDFEPDHNIVVTGGMLIIRALEDKINTIFLKTFFDSELGKQAIDAIATGSVIVSISAKDLRNINIPKVDIEKQNAIARKYNRYSSSLAAYLKEVEDLKNKINNLFDTEMED